MAICKPALQEIEALYTDNIGRLGLDAKSVGWRDDATHKLRFEILVQGLIPDNENESFTVNDIGSGYGAMFRYLNTRYDSRLASYCGYEISDAMIKASREFVPDDNRFRVIKSNVPNRKSDYSFACGTFNVKFETSNQIWETYIKDMIMHLANQSKRGFSFNLLTSYVDWKEPHLYYADPALYFDFCKRHVSRKVSLMHDYPLYEWTIIVHK